MKELTIEEKAKCYDEAIERVKKIHKYSSDLDEIKRIEQIFPELKESEDERIRKNLLGYIKGISEKEVCKETLIKWIAWIEKQGEQKPTNKIEPKFHEGEWITNGDYTWKIVEVKPLDYILQSQEGNIVDDTISHVDEQFHSFTIKDAKDGDVLACPLPKGCESGEQIFIFKGINSRDYVDNCIEYYCRICEGVFYENENSYMGTTSSPLYPATKEQRDALFAKMKEAGYEWDAEKKELKKISQRIVSAEVKEALYDKPAWSEEDDNCLSTIIAEFSKCSGKSVSKDEWMRCNDFLNSLEGRVQPQKQWKPSDEQMDALRYVTNFDYGGHKATLVSLYEQLKKLKE